MERTQPDRRSAQRKAGPPASTATTRPVDDTIGVLDRALALLDSLAAQDLLSLTELSKRSGLHKARAFRILHTLTRHGHVEREAATGHYRLGAHLIALGSRPGERPDLRSIARPLLQTLRADTGETADLAIPNDRRTVYLDSLSSRYALRLAAVVGACDDYHSTSLGKAIAATWPDAELERFLGRGPVSGRRRVRQSWPGRRRDQHLWAGQPDHASAHRGAGSSRP